MVARPKKQSEKAIRKSSPKKQSEKAVRKKQSEKADLKKSKGKSRTEKAKQKGSIGENYYSHLQPGSYVVLYSIFMHI